MESPDVQSDVVTQADLKLLRDQVDQLQLIVSEPRKPWYLEGSFLTSALAVLVALISFIISTQQGDQKELREKREEFRSVLEKLVSMSEELEKLNHEFDDPKPPEINLKIDYLHRSKDLYRSSAEMLAKDLDSNVLLDEYLIMGDQFQEDNNHTKATEYYKKALSTLNGLTSDDARIDRNRAYRRLALLQNSLLLNNESKMREYFHGAIDAVQGKTNGLMLYTTGATYRSWAIAESELNNHNESLDKFKLAEKTFIEMSDDDNNKHKSLDRVRHDIGQTFLILAEADHTQGKDNEFRIKLDEAEQTLIKISDQNTNLKQDALEKLRRIRLRTSSWIAAPSPSLSPQPLWGSSMLDEAIRSFVRKGRSSGSGVGQP